MTAARDLKTPVPSNQKLRPSLNSQMLQSFPLQVKDVAEETMKEEDAVLQRTPAMKVRVTVTDPWTEGRTTATRAARTSSSAAATTANSSASTSTRRTTAVRGLKEPSNSPQNLTYLVKRVGDNGSLGAPVAGDVEEALGPGIGTAQENLVITWLKYKTSPAMSNLADKHVIFQLYFLS